MLNYYYQKLIFYCILFATVWLKSSNALTIDEKIQFFENALIHLKENGPMPENAINYFRAWRSWPNVPKSLKVCCVKHFETRMKINSKSQITVEVGRMAYTILDWFCKTTVANIKLLFPNDSSLANGLQMDVLDAGKLFNFFEYCEQLPPHLVQEQKQRMKERFPHMTDSEAIFSFALPLYLTRVSAVR